MVPTCDYYPDKHFLFAFLLSVRLFIRPHELLEKVCQLCHVQQRLDLTKIPIPDSNTSYNTPSSSSISSAASLSSACISDFAKNVVQLLSEWFDTFPYDFRDEKLMQQVRTMTQKCININPSLHKKVSTILQKLLHELTVLDQYEEYLSKINSIIESNVEQLSATCSASCHHTSVSSMVGSGLSGAGDITELCSNPTQLAHQLTHIELERLSHIGPEEFVQAFAKDNPQLEPGFDDIKKTRNLESYVQWFNRLSYLVATDIVKVYIFYIRQFKSFTTTLFITVNQEKAARTCC